MKMSTSLAEWTTLYQTWKFLESLVSAAERVSFDYAAEPFLQLSFSLLNGFTSLASCIVFILVGDNLYL